MKDDQLDIEHKALVARLSKPGDEILKTLTPFKVDLWHMLTGMETEIGEIATTLKAFIIYNKELDVDNVMEELGDLRFYEQGLMNLLSLTQAMILQHNITKLNIRYPEGYNDKSAIERIDKSS